MDQLGYRELYCPGHFGNSYEVMAPYEMADVLREAKWWGFNAYSDWLDAADLKDPHNNPRNEYLLPQALWERKLQFFRLAQDAGFKTNLILTPNHVYLDQFFNYRRAEMDDERFFGGQLICPSNEEARAAIIDNHRKIFSDLKEKGVELSTITGCPFDYGGCSCQSCQPWVLTFGRLMAEIHEAAKSFFPQAKARLIGWWWTMEEHALFAEWADREEPGRFVSMAAHIPYDAASPAPGILLPKGCEPHAFVHIVYPDTSEGGDRYGAWGPMAAPKRLLETIKNLQAASVKGYDAYSEGLCDDVNKTLLAGVSSGRFPDASSVFAAYSERYFGANSAQQQAWANWLSMWGEPFGVDVTTARKEFDLLARDASPGWRLAQWEAKLRMFEAHNEVMKLTQWNKTRRTAAEKFITERDRLYREVWSLGLVRHALNPRYFQPQWYSEYARVKETRTALDEA